MPVSRRHAKNADLRTQAADKMQVDVKYVFFLPKSRSKPVLAIWTDGWTVEEIQRVLDMKPEIKALAAAFGAKIYMTPIHPHEQEAREKIRRKSRGPKYRQRQSEKRAHSLDARVSGGEDEPVAEANMGDPALPVLYAQDGKLFTKANLATGGRLCTCDLEFDLDKPCLVCKT